MNLWDADAALFAEHWTAFSAPARSAVADAVGLSDGVRVLDVGCGPGDFCALALERGARVSGIDEAPAMVAIARGRAPGAELVAGPMQRLPWEDGAFDVVTGFNSLQFAGEPVAALREWERVLRPGGRLAVCTWGPPADRGIAAVEEPLRVLAGAPAHGPGLGGDGVLARLARNAGLDVLADERVAVPLEVPDREALEAAFLFDAHGYGVPEAPARAAIAAAAAPLRRPDGSYRFENAFRYLIAQKR